MEKDTMLPQKIPKPEKKKFNIHRYLLATIFATLIGLAGLIVYRKFRSEKSEILDDGFGEILVTGEGLNVSAVITDEITQEQFSFDDVLNDGVDYQQYVDFEVLLPERNLSDGLWLPSSIFWSDYGEKYFKKSQMYDYHYHEENGTFFYDYRVKMKSMIGPDSARQRQTHVNFFKSSDRIVRKTKIETFDFPYSETFDLRQIWDIEATSPYSCRLRVFSGIHWISPPMFMIKNFIESDLKKSQAKINKYLRQILPLTD